MWRYWRIGLGCLIFYCTLDARTRLFADEAADVAAIIEPIGKRAVTVDKVVGVNIGVARGDKILCVKAFGLANIELNVAAKAETVYRIGSLSKQFTAAAIMLLVEEGEIDLDDPLTNYLPKYPSVGRKITIRNLLQHTSGIKDFTRMPEYRAEQARRVSPADVLDRFQSLPLDFEPGTQHRYCNSGYFVLALVVEEVAGVTFREFIRDNFLKVADLKQTYSDSHARIIPNRASGYARWGGILRNAPYLNLKQTIGAGNMASTVGDLLAWQRALVNGRLLKPSSFELMTTNGQLKDGKSFAYGMGLNVRKLGQHDVIRHGGGINGFRADLAWYPKSGYTIVVLANSENAKATRICDQVARRLLAVPAKSPAK